MKSIGTAESLESLSDAQRAALLNLLADEDPAVYRTLREKLLAWGPAAAQWLRPHRLSAEPALRRRALEIVAFFERQSADDVFLAFCLNQGEKLDLEEGAWRLARTQYPEINLEGYRALLDSYADELLERLGSAPAPHEIICTLNRYLFDELGFSGNEGNYYDPENSYLNRVLDRRTGNPINLCVVYLLLARRLKLPVAGIGLPGHFICRYQSTSGDIYLDVFNRGKQLTKADCIQRLLQSNFTVRDEDLAPFSPRRILLRICANLHQVYRQLENEEAATRLQRYLVALAR